MAGHKVNISKDIVSRVKNLYPHLSITRAIENILKQHLDPEVIESEPQVKSKSYLAREIARKAYPYQDRPNLCTECQKEPPTERHHLIPVRTLIRKNIHLDKNSHKCIWVCHTCHEKLEGRQFPDVVFK